MIKQMWFHDGELRCPKCRCELGQIKSMYVLQCSGCARRYPIGQGACGIGVPDLRCSKKIEKTQQETTDTFSRKWALDPLGIREERVRIANEWFLERFSMALEDDDALVSSPEAYTEAFLSGKKRILDAGCGLGNLTTLFATMAPHAEVWGVDLSSSLLLWDDPNGLPENVRLVRCDLRNVPIEGGFDLIVADGVLHHTPDTRESLYALLSRLNPEGHLICYLYKIKAPLREWADDYLRQVVGKMDEHDTLKLCEDLADLGRQLREAHVDLVIRRDIPELDIKAGTHDLHRFVYWHFLKCFWDDGGNKSASVAENYDWYRPQLAHRHVRTEVEEWIGKYKGVRLVGVHEGPSGLTFAIQRTG